MVAASPTTRAREQLREALERSRAEELDDLHRRHAAGRRRSLVLTWASGWLRPMTRAAIEPLPEVAPGELGLSWSGHATLIVRTARLAVACDPMLGHRLGVVRRAVQPGHTPAELDDVGLILISNADPDHLHAPTLARLPKSATIVVPPRCAELVSRFGFARLVEMGVGQSLSHRGVDVFSTSVRHVRDAWGKSGRGACAYVIRGDGPSVFFCGASGYFSGFGEIGRMYRPDIAALPIGGYVPRTFREDYMSPLDAIYAFEDLGARLLVPIRHGAFQLSYEDLDEPALWLRELVTHRELEPYVALLQPGQSRKFTHPGPPAASPAP